MSGKIFSLFLCLSLFSCYHENKEIQPIPKKLLTRDQMVDIMTDLQLSEGILTFRRIERLPVPDYGVSLYNKVIEEHQLTREQLQENIDYYNNDPKLMEKIYDEVLARLNKMQSELSSEAAKLDSIQNYKLDSIQMRDSAMKIPFINLVLIQENDSVQTETDTILNWNYLERLKIPDFIY
jgi:hypothetical protein